jgi:hypothetical protein
VAVAGSVAELSGEASVSETLTLGALFSPAGGQLAPGTYTATISAQNLATGSPISYSWSFQVVESPAPEISEQRIYLPIIIR